MEKLKFIDSFGRKKKDDNIIILIIVYREKKKINHLFYNKINKLFFYLVSQVLGSTTDYLGKQRRPWRAHGEKVAKATRPFTRINFSLQSLG